MPLPHDNVSPKKSRRVAVLGYSVRSLAEAVSDLGYEVLAIDHFNDQDTSLVAQCVSIPNWPQGIDEVIQRNAIDTVLLAGGMENLPELVSSLCDRGLLQGMDRTSLLACRSIESLRQLVHGTGINFPESRDCKPRVDPAKWIWKPYASSGGLGIRSAVDTSDNPFGYWQKFIQGSSIGVYFVIFPDGPQYCGATESLSGEDWPGPKPMIYRGSLGPIDLPESYVSDLTELAMRIYSSTNYRGWLQMDLVETTDAQLYLLEINPRWTAGMEILRIAELTNMARLHLQAIRFDSTTSLESLKNHSHWAAKAIFYAPHELRFWFDSKAEFIRHAMTRLKQDPTCHRYEVEADIADIPHVDQVFLPEQPVFTVRTRFAHRVNLDWQSARQILLAALKEIQPACSQAVCAILGKTQ